MLNSLTKISQKFSSSITSIAESKSKRTAKILLSIKQKCSSWMEFISKWQVKKCDFLSLTKPRVVIESQDFYLTYKPWANRKANRPIRLIKIQSIQSSLKMIKVKICQTILTSSATCLWLDLMNLSLMKTSMTSSVSMGKSKVQRSLLIRKHRRA